MKFFTDFFTNKIASAKKDISCLLLVFGIAFFQFLGRIPLVDPDEGRYAEIPREMLECGDFITPLLDYVKFFDKPPLHYWLGALSLSVFGRNEFAARFPGALMGLLTVLLTYHVGRRLFGRREGLLAALILGTSLGFLIQARINITDMTLTCTLSAALAFFILAVREGESRKGLYYHLFYLAAALAVLAKGLIGVVFPGTIIFLYLLITRRWKLLTEMRFATGIPLFFMLCAPWYILVSLKNPEFAWFFFIHEHFERFTSTVHHRYHGFWFFVPVLIGTMLPWSFFIPASIRGIWRERRSKGGNSRLYLLIWAAFIFIFFSISKSQLVPYILPVFPPLALLMGSSLALNRESVSNPLKIEGYIIAGLLTIGGAGIICYPHFAPNHGLSAIGGAVIGTIFLTGGIITLRNTFQRNTLLLFTGLLLCAYIAGIAGPPFILKGVAEQKSIKELGLIVKEKAGKDAFVASFGVKQGLSFYAQRRVAIIGGPAEMEFGSRQGDQSAWFPDFKRFTGLWDSPTPVFAVLNETELTQLQGVVKAAPTIVAQQGGKILITNSNRFVKSAKSDVGVNSSVEFGDDRNLVELWEIFCFLISLFGLGIRVFTVGHTPVGTPVYNPEKEDADLLNTTGIYSVVRHPLYLGNLIICLGISSFPHLWWLPLICILSFWIYYKRIMFDEEAALRDRFGKVYEDWSNGIPPLIPDIRKWKKPSQPFSLKNVLEREYDALFVTIILMFILDITVDYCADGKFEFNSIWELLCIISFIIWIVLRTLKNKTIMGWQKNP